MKINRTTIYASAVALGLISVPILYKIFAPKNETQSNKQFAYEFPQAQLNEQTYKKFKEETILKKSKDQKNKTRFICQLRPFNNSKLFGIINLEKYRIIDAKLSEQGQNKLKINLYQFGNLIEQQELGKKIKSVANIIDGKLQNHILENWAVQDIVGRSLVLTNQSNQILSAGVIGIAQNS